MTIVATQAQLLSRAPATTTRSMKTRHWACANFDIKRLDSLGVPIRRLVTDSRRIAPGDIFVAYPGGQHDSREFIAAALRSGCSGVLWESDQFSWNAKWRVPNIGIPKLCDCIGVIASKTAAYPSERLWMVGVTGTNGKTSCSHWIAKGLTVRPKSAAVIGTLGCGFLDKLVMTNNTTPDAVFIQSQLKKYVKQGVGAVVIEASSHGLAQGRLNGVEFDVALLTNLTHDHLDYHGNTRSYKAAKAKLFRFPSLRYAIVNLDDEFGLGLAYSLKQSKVEIIGYGFNAKVKLPSHVSRIIGRNLSATSSGLAFDIRSPWGSVHLRSTLIGKFNASNLLGSLCALLASGVELQRAVSTLQLVQAPSGRMQYSGGRTQPLVVVDYAHTPDALGKVLLSLRELIERPGTTRKRIATIQNKPKLICVFGCGGNRDLGKRPLMGAVASLWADDIILTNDNPREEDPEIIIQEIVKGIKSNYHVLQDRAVAILHAITSANKGDIVLIAGKGHENYQEIMGKKFPFNDFALVQTALAQKVH